MPEVTKIGYFLTDLIKKVDFFGDTVYMQPYNLCGELYSRMQCGTRLSQKKSRHSTTLNVELGSSSNTRPATQVRLSGGGTPDLRHRSGWVMVKQSNTRPATQVRLSDGQTVKHPTRDTGQVDWWWNSRPATQVRLSDGQTVKHPTRDTGQVDWWSNSRPATQVRWRNTRPATQVRFAKNESPSTKYTAWRSGSLSSDGHPWPTAVAHQ